MDQSVEKIRVVVAKVPSNATTVVYTVTVDGETTEEAIERGCDALTLAFNGGGVAAYLMRFPALFAAADESLRLVVDAEMSKTTPDENVEA